MIRCEKKVLTRILSLSLVFFTLCTCYADTHTIGGQANANDAIMTSINNVVCGQKCLEYILNYYFDDNKLTLITIIDEFGKDNIHQGTTLKSLSQYLNKNGIKTKAIGLTDTATLVWDKPVLVHMLPQSRDEIGHFVVWLPQSSSKTIVYWDNTVKEMTVSEWNRKRSGNILLTSLSNIKKVDDAVVYSGLPADTIFLRLLCFTVFLTGVFLCVYSFMPLCKKY